MKKFERQIDEHHNKDVHHTESPEKTQSRDRPAYVFFGVSGVLKGRQCMAPNAVRGFTTT
jgi:hypothetical protein